MWLRRRDEGDRRRVVELAGPTKLACKGWHSSSVSGRSDPSTEAVFVGKVSLAPVLTAASRKRAVGISSKCILSISYCLLIHSLGQRVASSGFYPSHRLMLLRYHALR